MKRYLYVIVLITFLFSLSQQTKAQSDQFVLKGGHTAPVNFAGAGCVFNWTNSNPAIGLPATGTGDIASFIATNTTASPITATITATPIALAYVSDLTSGSLIKMDLATNTVVGSPIPISVTPGALPYWTAISPDGSKVYVTNAAENSVSVISTVTNMIAATIPVGTYPFGIVLSSTKAYVVNQVSHDVTVINLSDNSIATTIQVGASPLGISISPDGSKVYVANSNSNDVSVIDVATDTEVLPRIAVGHTPYGTVVSPANGGEIYVTNTVSNTVSIINVATHAVATVTVGSKPQGITISPDGANVYVTNFDGNSVSVINTSTRQVSTIPLGPNKNPNGISLNYDGTIAYVVDQQPGEISVIDFANNNAITTIHGVGTAPYGFGNFIVGHTGCTPVSFNITVNAVPPSMSATGTLAALTTTYGTPSATTTFDVSGTDMTSGIVVTPPAGFEVSTSPTTGFGSTVTVGAAGTIPSTTVYVRLAATTPVGNSYAGDVVLSTTDATDITVQTVTSTVTPAPLSIATGDVTKTYGDVLTGAPGSTMFTPGALQNGETISSVTITYGTGAGATDAAGTHTGSVMPSAPVAASGSGFLVSNYDITYVPADIIVNKAIMTITVGDVSKTYGATLATPASTTTFTSPGLKNGETIGSVDLAYGPGAGATDAVGTHTNSVTPSGAVAASGSGFLVSNYDITYTPADIIVSKAALTITVSNTNKVYGTALISPASTTIFTPTGLQNSEIIGSVELAYGSGRDATDAVGTYSGHVTPSGGTAAPGSGFLVSNYDITYTPADIVVSKAPLAITVSDVNKTYGATLTSPASTTTFTPTGLQNSETIGSVSLAYGTGAAATDAVGTHTNSVTPVSATAATGSGFLTSNYDISYVPANIIVGAAVLTITASPVNKTYGTALTSGANSPAFTTSGLQNGETVDLVGINYTAGAAANSVVGTYIGSAVPFSTSGGSFNPANYTINYVPGDVIIGAAPLTIVATFVNKTYGTVLTSPATSTAFTPSGLKNGETIAAVTMTYGTGSAGAAIVGTYINSVTPLLATGGTFTASNYNITYVRANIVVTQAALTVTAGNVSKAYGTAIAGGVGSTAFTTSGLRNGETVGAVTTAYGLGSAAISAVNTYTGSVTQSAITGGNFNAGNYAVTYIPGNIVVTPAALTITANNVSKPYGTLLTGNTASTAFTVFGLENAQTVTTVAIAYGAGADAGAAVGTYTGTVTASSVTGGNFTPVNYVTTYVKGNIIVNPVAPTITASSIGAVVTTVYGTSSSSTGFTVSGINITTGILVTAPTGFEVSKDNNNFSNTVTINGTGIIAATSVYIRLTPFATAGNHLASIVLSSAGAVNYNIAITGIVTPAPLTITAKNADKTYGSALNNVTGSVAFTSRGLQNGETIGYVKITYGTGAATGDAAGIYSASVTASLPADGTFSASNYAITYNNGNITVHTAPLIIAADNKSRLYGEFNPTLTITYIGFVNNEGPAQLVAPPLITTTITVASPVGQYPITVGNAVSHNYAFNYVTGVFTITPIPGIIVVPNTFTPNGDGVNDTWVIKHIEDYPKCSVTIFNRYGKEIFFSNGYPIPWDGRYNGSDVPAGTYYYIINLSADIKPVSGFLAIIR